MKKILEYRAFYLLSMLMFAFTLQGCAALGYENVDTTRKAILVATAEVRDANALLQDLVRRSVIDDENAREALAGIKLASQSLRTGLTAIDVAGDPITAQNNLARANTALTIALTVLTKFAEDSS